MLNCLFINKPKGMTSFDVCFKLRKVLNTKKIGHTGTLDPNATGVMIILYDNSTKLNQFLVSEKKEYICEVKVGIETDTLDIDGNILKEEKTTMPDMDSIKNVLNSFLGHSKQTVPLTSAIKVNGKRLYQYQKENKDVDLPQKDIDVYEIELLNVGDDTFCFRCLVSSGTYIRSLARDILKELMIIGTVCNLTRTRINEITINDCDNLEDVLKGEYTVHDGVEILKKNYDTINLNDPRLAKNGRRLKLNSNSNRILITSDNKAIAIYEKDGEEYRSLRGLL